MATTTKNMFEGMEVTGVVLELDTTKVQRYKEQPRSVFDRGELDKLKESIGQLGQIDPVHVEELNGTGKRGKTHELIDGERRFQVCSELGRPVRALVCSPRDANLKFLHSIAANCNRADHTPMETSRALRKIRAMPFIKKLKEGEKMEAIGRFFGKSELWAWNYWGLIRLSEDLQSSLEAKEMPITVAVKLSGMPKKLQTNLWREITDRGLKTAAAIRYINKAIQEHDLDSSRRGRRPSDDWDLLRMFMARTGRGLAPFLDLQAADGFGDVIKSRSLSEVNALSRELKGTIARLQGLQRVIVAQERKMGG